MQLTTEFQAKDDSNGSQTEKQTQKHNITMKWKDKDWNHY